MKKHLLIFIMIIILVSLCGCSSNGNSKTEDNSISQASNVSQDNADNIYVDDTTDTENIDSSENTILIRYFRQRKELPYNDEMKSILGSIKNCVDKPDANLENKIGSISIRHNSDEGSEDFAIIYIGEDDNIYAKYIDSINEETAYKLDIEAFGLE